MKKKERLGKDSRVKKFKTPISKMKCLSWMRYWTKGYNIHNRKLVQLEIKLENK